MNYDLCKVFYTGNGSSAKKTASMTVISPENGFSGGAFVCIIQFGKMPSLQSVYTFSSEKDFNDFWQRENTKISLSYSSKTDTLTSIKSFLDLQSALKFAYYYLGKSTLKALFPNETNPKMLADVNEPANKRQPIGDDLIEMTDVFLQKANKTMKQRREEQRVEAAYSDNPEYGLF